MAGCACGPYSWSDSPASCLSAPAGLVRLRGLRFTLYSTVSNADNNSILAAAAGKLGDDHYGAAAGIIRSETDPDTLRLALSTARTLRGDPIGFMDGVFGPSISVGTVLGFTSTEDGGGEPRNALSIDLGFQFSVFPTVAVGMNVSDLRILGDDILERTIGYGFTTIFDKRFRGHFTVTGGNTAVGFELGVNDWLTVRTGSDGSSWNSGATLSIDWFSLDWAVLLDDEDCRQAVGISVSPGGQE